MASTNIHSAKQAIEAELSHARQGIAFYAARVEALESALQQLETVENETSATPRRETRKAVVKNRSTDGATRTRLSRNAGGASRRALAKTSSIPLEAETRRRPGRQAAGKTNAADSIPSTGGDFWLKLVSDEPKSAIDISKAAIAALGLKPEQKAKIRKLKQRVAPALAGLVSTHKIKDSGAGRERRFFKNGNQAA